MTEAEIIQLRCDPADREALEQGLHVTFVQIALGEDGVFELHLESDEPIGLPDGSATPAVPLAEGDR